MHKKDIAHRDIKPENILLDSDFNIKVCDFGWASLMNQKDERKSICGTYEYMPPEVVNQEPQTLKTDLWSLGILLYELLHGNAPFRANSLEEIKLKIKEHQIFLNKNLSKETKDIVKLLLRKESEKRCSSEEILAYMAHHFDINKFVEPISLDEKFVLFKNLFFNKYKITDENVIRERMMMDSLTIEEKEQNRKMPLKFFNQKGINQDLVDQIRTKGILI